MPKRVIDFDALWGSDKLAACAEWAQAEYAWLYGLADASGCFELTNLRVIWGRVAAVRRNLTIERLEQVFDEFRDKGLLFVWEHDGKRYGHWTGSDVPGRLPPPSWRMRLERLAPPVPKREFAEYVSRFARGRAALGGGGFRAAGVEAGLAGKKGSQAEACATGGPIGDGLKDEVEEAQAEDWKWDLDLNRNSELNRDSELRGGWNREKGRKVGASGLGRKPEGAVKSACAMSSSASVVTAAAASTASAAGVAMAAAAFAANRTGAVEPSSRAVTITAPGPSDGSAATGAAAPTHIATPGASSSARDKAMLVARELRVGQGPLCGPVRVRDEALERIRARENALREKRAAVGGARSP
jgi:hypothetical protein